MFLVKYIFGLIVHNCIIKFNFALNKNTAAINFDHIFLLLLFISFFCAYCRSGNTREVLIFARWTNSWIQESRENYYYISVIQEKWKFANYKLSEKS